MDLSVYRDLKNTNILFISNLVYYRKIMEPITNQYRNKFFKHNKQKQKKYIFKNTFYIFYFSYLLIFSLINPFIVFLIKLRVTFYFSHLS